MSTYNADLEINDIKTGQMYDPLMAFLLFATQNGWPIQIYALKSDHSKYTTEGNLSAHGLGKAVDCSNYSVADYVRAQKFMRWLAKNQGIIGFSQIIGPDPLLCLGGPYDLPTLNQHKSHVHVGWAI
jgi:hypothetical protein